MLYLGQYPDGTEFRRTSHRTYTHAVIPVYTSTRGYITATEGPWKGARVVPIVETCEPYYGKPTFCGRLDLAQKKAKPGWLIVELTKIP